MICLPPISLTHADFFTCHAFWPRYESTLRGNCLGVEPAEIIECVKECPSESQLDEKLAGLFPKDLKVHAWNRKVVQMGMSDMALDKLEEIKADLGAGQRQDLRSFADVIDFDEGKLE